MDFLFSFVTYSNLGNGPYILGLPLTPKTPHNPRGLRTVANQTLIISLQDYVKNKLYTPPNY